MAAHLSEEEQIEALKKWWKENGTQTVGLIALLAIAFFGWNFYTDSKQAAAEQASVQYEAFMSSVEALEALPSDAQDKQVHLETARQAGQNLISEQSSGLYVDFARLQLAKLAMEEKDYQNAAALLAKVRNTASTEEVKSVATARLARVFAAQSAFSEALAIVEENDSGKAFQSVFQETKGDIYMMQQNLVEARSAYEEALTYLGDNDFQRKSLIQFKIDNTKVAEAAAEDGMQSSAPSEETDTVADTSGSEGA